MSGRRYKIGDRASASLPSDGLSRLRDLRVKADYYEDQVHYDEASEAAAMAQRLVTSLLERTTR